MPTHAVKGIIGASEPPPEARVSRLDECRLKQKVGYGQHANPHHHLLYFLYGCHFASFQFLVEHWRFVQMVDANSERLKEDKVAFSGCGGLDVPYAASTRNQRQAMVLGCQALRRCTFNRIRSSS